MNRSACMKLGVSLLLGLSQAAMAQSSSLYVAPVEPMPPLATERGVENRLSPAVAQSSYTAVRIPDPKMFAVHDLVTIVIRESTESDADAKLNTKKENNINGQLSDFPNLNMADLLQFRLNGGTPTNAPGVGLKFKNEFKSDGQYSRKDTFTSRITAEVIDVKPNGTLVLEARKFIKTDKETLEMVLTGTCRKQDVAVDNTVLSTQMFDLHLQKKHSGELRGATDKGILTQFFELLFNF